MSARLRVELLAAGARPDQLATVADDLEGVHALDARERAIQLIQNWT